MTEQEVNVLRWAGRIGWIAAVLALVVMFPPLLIGVPIAFVRHLMRGGIRERRLQRYVATVDAEKAEVDRAVAELTCFPRRSSCFFA
jgi:hypothetical protein